MKRTLTLVCCLCLAGLSTSCGDRAVDDELRARNLKTGAVETFAAADEVPDGYVVCPDEACSVPLEVPCQGLGAMTCQLHQACAVQVLSCQDGSGGQVPLPGGSYPGSADAGAAPGAEPDPRDETIEICEVSCVPAGPQACEAIANAEQCLARPECQWGEIFCATCACPDGFACDCPPEPICEYGCVTQPQPTCGDLQSEAACLANPGCQWGEFLCPGCTCPPGVECDCTCQPSCVRRTDLSCEAQTSEAECLSDPACEWGQFVCPPCVLEADESGALPPACDCGLSCRARDPQCPEVALPAIGCPDGAPLEPVYDASGCVSGWSCGQPHECPEVLCDLYCENGFATGPDGCAICACQPTECVRTGCSGQLCAAEHLASDCQWREHYSCYDLAVCGLDEAGRCGWLPTEAFSECLASFGQ